MGLIIAFHLITSSSPTCLSARRGSHPQREPVDVRMWIGVAGSLAQTVAEGDHADTHGGIGRGTADAEPRQGSHLHGSKDRTTDPNTGPVSRRPELPCQCAK